jgi:Ras-related protein Rab-18
LQQFDVTRRDTFQNIKEWLKEVDLYTTSDQIVKMLVGNKIDLESDRVVSAEEGREFARNHGMLFIQTSAKTNTGVSAAFEELVLKIMDNPVLTGDFRGPMSGAVTLEGNDVDSSDTCPC